MEKGNDALRLDRDASNYFQKAVAIEPKSATAWGLLAYSLANGVYRSSKLTGENAAAADTAARKSLAIDTNEPHALLALGFIQNGVRDWYSRERSLRHILEIAPDNPLALRSLGQFLHAVGRCIESLAVVERALAVQPLAPDNWLRKAGRLWVLGDVAEADHVIDRAMQLWPWHPVVRLIRLMIYAFTGRPQAALAMIDEEQKTPTFMSRPAAPVWRTSLFALEKPTTAAKAAARKASLEGSQGSLQVASSAILLMSALGELDAAFEIAGGYLLNRGSIIVRPPSYARLPRGNDPSWRNTFGLFTPPTKAMRLDPRFKSLADGVGLSEYWQKRGIGPDAFLFRP
jgi:Flp pilus assembly protein TadD